ncbi:MAG: hypothetical protein U1D41_04585 [Nitrosomonas sp.]|uniref:hypothetical protein n=1 Tax=Nitrosomonas sp. TaxID=42353 RepID=UPI00273169CB|nr:hypothetical protein [Nitrosomonas sp.]MDP1550447.1 hypothetical protein [Nitrosomonas sp.]MDP3664097.1 hypothetical protein [Nitrosomonas sp.]MDZ4105434.1 hypothetical protein [Nitrosomonas sp.]
MKHEAHGTQQPRHIDKIGEGASTAQRSDSFVQPINQRFPNLDQQPHGSPHRRNFGKESNLLRFQFDVSVVA